MSFPTRQRAFVAALVTAMLTGAVLTGGALPAAAQDAPTRPDVGDPAVSVAIELFRTRTKLDAVTQQVADAQARLEAAQAALAESEKQIAINKAKIDEIKTELQGRAAQVYTEQGLQLDKLLAVEDVQDLAVGEHYTTSAAVDSNRKLDKLNALERALEIERAKRDAAKKSIETEKAQLDGLRAELDAARARDEVLLDRMGGVPIMGDSRLTGEQIAAWYHSTGSHANLAPGMSIDELAKIYVEEGAMEHVRGDIAFAQAMIETGGFGEAPLNNYAGVGTCDSCNGGYGFATPRNGVRGQIQLLRSYADPDSRASNLANMPEPGVFGEMPGAAVRYDTFGLKGKAPLWNVMGGGNWATDPTYAPKVIEMYARMLGFNALNS